MAKVKTKIALGRVIEYLKTLATTVKQNKADIAGLKSGGSGGAPVWTDITTTWKQHWSKDQVGQQMRFTTSTHRVWSGIITQDTLFTFYVSGMLPSIDRNAFVGWVVNLTTHTAQSFIYENGKFINPTDMELIKVERLE